MILPGVDDRTREIGMAQLPDLGAHVIRGFSGASVEGVLATYHIALPPFSRGVYFAADGEGWPSDANRVLPWILRGDCGGLFREGYQSVAVGVRLDDGDDAGTSVQEAPYDAEVVCVCF